MADAEDKKLINTIKDVPEKERTWDMNGKKQRIQPHFSISRLN